MIKHVEGFLTGFRIEKICLLTIFFALFFSINVYAEQTLMLEQCMSLAIKNNHTLRAGSSNVDAFIQEEKMSYAGFFPKVRSEAQYTLRDKEQTFTVQRNAFSPGIPPSNTVLPAGEKNMYSFTFSVEQPVFTGGYLTNSYQKAGILRKESEANLKRIRNELILKVKSLFYHILILNKMKEIKRQDILLKEENIRVAKELHKEGNVLKEDVLFIESELSRQKFELFEIENDLNIRKKELKNLIGSDYDEEILLTDELKNKRLVVDLEQSRELAYRNRTDLIQNDFMMKSAQQDIEIARSNFYPEASMIGSYTRQKETTFENPEIWSLQLLLRWNIFEWGKTQADVKRAAAKYDQFNIRQTILKKDITLDVEDKWFKVKESEQKVDVAKANLIYAQEHFRNTEMKFKENLLKTLDRLEAETNFIKKKNEYIINIYSLNKALAEFEFSVSSDISRLVIEDEIYDVADKTVEEIQQQAPDNGRSFDDTGTIEEPAKKEDVKQISVIMDDIMNDEYYIQVGSWKDPHNAQKMLLKLKKDYPEAFIVMQNNFSKVRIPDVKNKKQGETISQHLKEKLNLRALLVSKQ